MRRLDVYISFSDGVLRMLGGYAIITVCFHSGYSISDLMACSSFEYFNVSVIMQSLL